MCWMSILINDVEILIDSRVRLKRNNPGLCPLMLCMVRLYIPGVRLMVDDVETLISCPYRFRRVSGKLRFPYIISSNNILVKMDGAKGESSGDAAA